MWFKCQFFKFLEYNILLIHFLDGCAPWLKQEVLPSLDTLWHNNSSRRIFTFFLDNPYDVVNE